MTAATASLLAVTGLAPTGAAFTATTGTQAGWSAATPVATSGATAVQECRAASAPALRGSSSTAGDASTTVELSTPHGVEAGDLLLAGITWHADAAVPTPDGWTRVRSDVGTTVAQAVFSRVAVAGEPTTHTFTHVAGYKYGGIIAHSGVDPLPLLSSGRAGELVDGAVSAPSLTTRRERTVVVGFFGVVGRYAFEGDRRMATRYTGSSTGTEDASAQVSALAAVETRPEPGATDGRTATATAAGTATATATTGTGPQAVGQLVALEPPCDGA